MYNFEENALEELIYWRNVNLKNFDKTMELLKDIKRNGALKGIGKPEKLTRQKDLYSRRIDKGNRLIYRYSAELITVISCKGHYENL